MAKTTPWTKIKAEYLQGTSPKELAQKYKLTAKQVSNKAYAENWAEENKIIKENLRKNIQDRIHELSSNALEVLNEVINDPEAEYKDKISACRAILDVSGLKSLKQEVTNKSAFNIVVADSKHKQMLEEL